MDRDRVSRNDPCLCGSGKKYKNCCMKSDNAGQSSPSARTITDLHGKSKNRVEYPVGTVALYGPDDKITTKIAAGVVVSPNAKAIIERWVATDVTTNPKIHQQMIEFFTKHGVKSIAASSGNMGCPHEEGPDFLVGTDCSLLPILGGQAREQPKRD